MTLVANICNETVQFAFSRSCGIPLTEKKEMKSVREEWIYNIRWNCHRKMDDLNQQPQLPAPEMNFDNCQFCISVTGHDIRHIPAICDKLNYMHQIVTKFLSRRITLRVLSKQPNAKDKLKLTVQSSKHSFRKNIPFHFTDLLFNFSQLSFCWTICYFTQRKILQRREMYPW